MSAPGEVPTSVDVAVVGGGMVGMTLGIALAAAGFEVAVLDRDPPASHQASTFDGRASALAAASVRALASLGVWDRLAPLAQPILEIRVSDGDSPLFLHYDHRDVGDEPLGRMVENRHVIRALADRAAELPTLALAAGVAVTAFAADAHRATLGLADGRTLSARLVCAADGARSGLRDLAGIGHRRWSYRQHAIVCTVRHERAHRGIAHERFLPAGPFAILPLAGDRSSLVWTEREDLAPALLALDEPDFLDDLGLRFGDFMGDLALEGPRWSYPLALTLADAYLARRLVLVGDAAHAIHPIAGQGFNLGIRDLAALAEVLADARALGLEPGDPVPLARYAAWRRADVLALAAVTDGLNRLFSNDIPPVRLARALGLAAVNRMPPLKRLFMRHAMGTVGTIPRLMRG
jgi:2-octaprenyl-6-methoxyphenol hydroxylase